MILAVFCVLLTLSSIWRTSGTSKSKIYRADWRGPSPAWTSKEMIRHAGHLCESYFEQTGGQELLPGIMDLDAQERCQALFLDAGHVVLSHGTQNEGEGPILNYGNMAGLKLWSASWEELTTMPSRRTAEPMNQEKRAAFMREVTESGIVKGYEGVRIGLNGARFAIKNAVVWNIVVEKGVLLGQAAMFKEVEYM